MAVSSRSRVIVAMSGGVDSSVAAARLVAAGHEVVGVTLHLWDYPDDGSVRGRCCAPEDQYDARRVADRLGIPHFSFDRRADFLREVVEPFVDGYASGETPSPCVSCNRGVKLREIFAIAHRLGADLVSTGHYARVIRDEQGVAWLAPAKDAAKDQSYFLHALSPEQLAKLVFPLAEATKPEIRAEAAALGLPGADKGESQELCFVPTGRYDAFIEKRAKERIRPGPILDANGNVVAQHQGVHRFTIGQRKGLGVALGQPAFVVGIDAATSTVRLGSADALDVVEIEADQANFAASMPMSFEAVIKARARHEGALGTVELLGNGLARISFVTPVRAVTPGQFAVAYEHLGAEPGAGAGSLGRVLGGARIRRVITVAQKAAASLADGGILAAPSGVPS
ncbi:MAG: tRNA 2-thiouridine(34) synthase MnmA [Polyangiaceae bacterium]